MLVGKLQKAMWEHVGLLRDEESLRAGQTELVSCQEDIERFTQEARSSRRLYEARSLCMVADSILKSGLARTESRGAHYRSDFPRRDDQHFRKHSIFGREQHVVFEEW